MFWTKKSHKAKQSSRVPERKDTHKNSRNQGNKAQHGHAPERRPPQKKHPPIQQKYQKPILPANAPPKSAQKTAQNAPKTHENLPIGQTLETQDKYLPYNKKTSQKLKDSRPAIIVEKQKNPKGEEEYAIVTGSTKKESLTNTTAYNRNGIARYRHYIEVVDDEGKPIQQNDKFRKTKNCSIIPDADVDKIKNHVLLHTKQSSENRVKMDEFKNRYKK